MIDADGLPRPQRSGRRAADGSGPTLMLVEFAWTPRWQMWDAADEGAHPAVSRDRYDRRGHGKSSVPRPLFQETLRRDVLAILDDLNIERCW